jgi:N-formylglutamate deformylase
MRSEPVPHPFDLTHPAREQLPVMFDSPHSGRFYPVDFRMKPPLAVMRRGEDAYVDRLIADACEAGVTVLAATYPRCYIDANRDPDDLDYELLSEPWPTPLKPTNKTRRGLGLVRRYLTPGVEVHRDKLTVAEVRHRLDRVYWPYHRALDDALDRLQSAHGFVWHIDWHSMKSVGNGMTPDAGKTRADIVIGDLDGRSCDSALTALLAESFRALGYRVALNDPYKGAAIVRRHGAPHRNRHSIQIEINRALYLDEAAVEPSNGFDKLRADIATVTARVVEAAKARLR